MASPYQSRLACQGATNISHYHRREFLSMGSGVFRCIMCENIFTKKFDLLNHMRSTHLGSDKEEDFVKKVQGEEAEVQVKGKTIHKCAKCGERYRKLPTLNLHMREDHPDAGENKDDQDQPVKEEVKHNYAKLREIEKKEVGQENNEEVTVSEKECDENNMDHKVDMKPYESRGVFEGVERGDGETMRQDFKDENKCETEDMAVCKDESEDANKDESEDTVVFESEDEDKSETEDIVVSEQAQVKFKIDSDTIELEDKKEAMEVRFVCDYCGKYFVHKRTLREHNIKLHPQKVQKQKFRGALDWVPFRTESESGKPKCVQCGKEFPGVSNLKMHVRYVHIRFGRVICIECGKEISSMKNLKIHKRNVHMAEKKYRGHSDWKPYRSESENGKPKCKKCEKEYSSVGNLRGHVKYVHLKKEPRIRPQEPEDERICMICERLFDKTINMKLHLVKHTKIYKNLNIEPKISRSEDRRSATCLECGKWDGRSNNIKQHIAQVHYALHKTIDFNNKENFDFSEGGTALKKAKSSAKKKEIKTGVFRCFMCEKSFTEKLALMNHVNSIH